MSGGQIAALIVAIILLLPGGCFLMLGVRMTFGANTNDREMGQVALVVAIGILSLTGWLVWVALRRRSRAAPPLDKV